MTESNPHCDTPHGSVTAAALRRKLCAVMVDSVGREIFVQQPVTVDAEGWPVHGDEVEVKAGDRVSPLSPPPPQAVESPLHASTC